MCIKEHWFICEKKEIDKKIMDEVIGESPTVLITATEKKNMEEEVSV